MRRYLILILNLFFVYNLYTQEKKSYKTIEVTYTKAYKNWKDTTSNAPKLMKNMEYQLLMNNNEARFEYIKSMSIDGDNTNDRFIGYGGGAGVYYKNLMEKKYQVQIESADNEVLYLVQEDWNKYDWTLHKQSKEIMGYACFKATTQYSFFSAFKNKNVTLDITVWYTPSIPTPFGPAGYDGLPGLVLESHQASFYLIATDIKFHDKSLSINRPKKGLKLSREEYYGHLFKRQLDGSGMTQKEWNKMVEEMKKKKQ